MLAVHLKYLSLLGQKSLLPNIAEISSLSNAERQGYNGLKRVSPQTSTADKLVEFARARLHLLLWGIICAWRSLQAVYRVTHVTCLIADALMQGRR